MRIGIDGSKIPEAAKRGVVGSVQHAAQLGLGGIFFRHILELSPTLDTAELKSARDVADDLDLYFETGLGKVNPFSLPEQPEIRDIGDGDTVLGFRRMMEAAASISCTELWASTANYKPRYAGKFACDRFRTDVLWDEQLEAIARLLERLAPIARELGQHINLETHEEITSFELVRLVERVGPDVVGIVFDTANALQRLEHPVMTAQRVAPYVRQVQVKDAHLERGDGGVYYQMRPAGQGVVDFAQILPILAKHNPGLNLTIENWESQDDRARVPEQWLIELDDPDFLRGHPDLTGEERAALLELVDRQAQLVAGGDILDRVEYARAPFGFDECIAFINSSHQHVRAICDHYRLPLEDARPSPGARPVSTES